MSSTAAVNIPAYIASIYTLLFVVSQYIVVTYAEPGFPWHTYITLVIGYFSSFGILLLVPIDIAAVVIDRRSTNTVSDPTFNSNTALLSQAYSVFFTLVLVMGSVVLVLEEYYNTDGYFTIFSRVLSTIKRFLIDTFLGIIAGVIILGVLIGQHVVGSSAQALQLSAVIVTNTVYETLLMFLLGYGLVEYPRHLLVISSIDAHLTRVYNRAAMDFKGISDASLTVSLVVSDVMKTKEQLSAYGDQRLNDAMQIMLTECPSEFRSSRMGKVATNKSGQVTIDSLAALRTRLNYAKDRYRMSQAKCEGTKLRAYQLEDLSNAIKSGNRVIQWTLTKTTSSSWEYTWYCEVKPIVLKLVAFVAFGLSVLSFVGVICSMKGVNSKASPYFKIVHDNSSSTSGSIVVFIFVSLGYTLYVTIWSLFQMRIEGMMELVEGRTTPESLSFNVRMCARLAAPLAFFYLGWIAENGLDNGPWTSNNGATYQTYENVTISIYNNVTQTYTNQTITELVTLGGPISMPSAFSRFYQLQSVRVIKQTFGTIFPIILYCVVGLILPNIMNRVLVFVKLGNFQFGDPIVSEEVLREGKRQLERQRQSTERTIHRNKLRNYIINMGKAGSGESSGGLLSSLFASRAPRRVSRNSGESNRPVLTEPESLVGVVEKKGTGTFGVTAGWIEFNCETLAPGELIFKDKRTNQIESTVDLSTVVGFTIPAPKPGKEAVVLELDLGQTVIRMRFKSANDAENWKTKLLEWKDYSVDFGQLYGTRIINKSVNDIESNTTTSSNNKAAKTKRTSKPLSALDELDSIQVDVSDDEGEPPVVQNRGLLSIFGNKKKNEVQQADASVDEKPQHIEGWLDKKGQNRVHMGSDWQKRYIRIDERTGALNYYKTSSPSESPTGSIDLRMVVSISSYEKSGKDDPTRFNIDLGDKNKVYKFKASSRSEGERWIKTLNEWRDYFLLTQQL